MAFVLNTVSSKIRFVSLNQINNICLTLARNFNMLQNIVKLVRKSQFRVDFWHKFVRDPTFVDPFPRQIVQIQMSYYMEQFLY